MMNATELKEMLDVLNQYGVAQATFGESGSSFIFFPKGKDPEYKDAKEPGTPPPAKIRIVTDDEILLNPYAGLEA